MKNQIINEIMQNMLPHLDNMELEQLQKILKVVLTDYDVIKSDKSDELEYTNSYFLELFLSAKKN